MRRLFKRHARMTREQIIKWFRATPLGFIDKTLVRSGSVVICRRALRREHNETYVYFYQPPGKVEAALASGRCAMERVALWLNPEGGDRWYRVRVSGDGTLCLDLAVPLTEEQKDQEMQAAYAEHQSPLVLGKTLVPRRVSFMVGERRMVATLVGVYPKAVHLRDNRGQLWILAPEVVAQSLLTIPK